MGRSKRGGVKEKEKEEKKQQSLAALNASPKAMPSGKVVHTPDRIKEVLRCGCGALDLRVILSRLLA